MNISLEGYRESCATFKTNSALFTIKPGDAVYLNEDGLIEQCGSGDLPLGVAVSVDGDFVTVQTHGYARVRYIDNPPTLGFTFIKGAKGAAIVPGTYVDARSCLVVDADLDTMTAGIIF